MFYKYQLAQVGWQSYLHFSLIFYFLFCHLFKKGIDIFNCGSVSVFLLQISSFTFHIVELSSCSVFYSFICSHFLTFFCVNGFFSSLVFSSTSLKVITLVLVNQHLQLLISKLQTQMPVRIFWMSPFFLNIPGHFSYFTFYYFAPYLQTLLAWNFSFILVFNSLKIVMMIFIPSFDLNISFICISELLDGIFYFCLQ